MEAKPVSIRKMKGKVLELLGGDEREGALAKIGAFTPRQVVNPLIGLFCHGEDRIRFRATAAMGAVVSALADTNMESARVVMRRLLWTLNDESGGIGWGAPEALGEIMACHEALADEYCRMLGSYINAEGNYLEHELLQRGALWGVGRLAAVRPKLISFAAPFLVPYTEASDPFLRGLAARAAGALGEKSSIEALERIRDDAGELAFFSEWDLVPSTVGQLASEALARLEAV